MIAMFAGSALMLAGTGFLVRFSVGAKEATRWPMACVGTRIVLLMMGVACVMRGMQLVGGDGRIDAAGAILSGLIAVYSVMITARDLKQKRLVFHHGGTASRTG